MFGSKYDTISFIIFLLYLLSLQKYCFTNLVTFNWGCNLYNILITPPNVLYMRYCYCHIKISHLCRYSQFTPCVLALQDIHNLSISITWLNNFIFLECPITASSVSWRWKNLLWYTMAEGTKKSTSQLSQWKPDFSLWSFPPWLFSMCLLYKCWNITIHKDNIGKYSTRNKEHENNH